MILNAVDLNLYTPNGPETPPANRCRMMLLEGSLAGGLNNGLFHAVRLAEAMSQSFPMEVMVAGRVDSATQARIQKESRVPVDFRGMVPLTDAEFAIIRDNVAPYLR